jgi:competence protein ComEC
MSSASQAAALGRRRTAWIAPDLRALLAAAWAREAEERRFFLWIPIAAIGGVALNLAAPREPALGPCAAALALTLVFAFAARRHPLARGLGVALAALCAGFLSMGLSTQRAHTVMLDRIRIVTLRGRVEQVDFRDAGARFVVAVEDADDLADAPRRVRLTARKTPDLAAGDRVEAKARLLPPPPAVLPGGYSFARDAYFEGIGAVGSSLGAPRRLEDAAQPSAAARLFAALDRARNRLALRVVAIVGGDEGAVAAAMVTGKRDFLSQDARDLIREAGIFHIITISGVQMTLVAGIFFVGARRLMALSPTLALRLPIKKIAALIAMAGSLGYDLMTGSRVGTERALVMTLIVLGAAVLDRRALTMRNLALAILAVVALEPQAVMGVSFQLSFAAVAALVAVMEARLDASEDGVAPPTGFARLTGGLRALSFATLCATSATASFMAYHFHDLSPYVLIGNPLTLATIEFFAVPGALLGTALYPLGLDAPVWLFVGLGVKLVLLLARLIAAAPGSTLYVPAFAPWALPFLALGVASLVIWRTWTLRAGALAFFALGLCGAMSGPRYDVIVAPSGDEAALRDADGRLALLGRRHNAYADEQWLAADGDGRDAAAARLPAATCDRLACVGDLPEGQALSVVTDRAAFEEDCARAAVVVSALTAPASCKPALLLDERRLAVTGAVGLVWDGARFRATPDRPPGLDRPWSPAPPPAQREISSDDEP